MIRLLISILCALGLAFAPVAAGAAALQMSGMPGCTMNGKMPSKPADHAAKDCCTPACQAPSSALLPGKDSAARVRLARSAMMVSAIIKELASAPTSGLDPPPRA